MAGGQVTTLSPGTVSPEGTVALTGTALALSQGTIVADAGSGIAIEGEGLDVLSGALASSLFIGLRSRKTGSGSASRALTGASMTVSQGQFAPVTSKAATGTVATFSQGAFGKTRSRAMVGTSVTVSPGTLTFTNTTGVTWVGVVPTVSFTQGTAGTYNLVQHTLNFNSSLHKFEVQSGTLPGGITLDSAAGYIYNGVTASSSASIVLNIADIPVIPPDDGTRTGLDWDGTASGGRRMLFWSSPPSAYPMTYLFKVFQRNQVSGVGDGTRYYTTFFHGNNGSFTWGAAYGESYYGAHPYPEGPGNPGTRNGTGDGKWEISVDGNDFTQRDNGTSPYPTYGQWYSQAFVATQFSPTTSRQKFYVNLPAVSTLNVITHDSTLARTTPPSPAIMFGQAPDNGNNQSWGGYSRWEEQNAIIRGIQIYSTALTEAQVVALSALETDAQVIAQCAIFGITPWYLNMNPTPTDVTDKKGSGTLHSPSWAGSSRPTLYTTLTLQSDWDARRTGPGVVRTLRFDTNASVNNFRFSSGVGLDTSPSAGTVGSFVRRNATEGIFGDGALELEQMTNNNMNSYLWLPFDSTKSTWQFNETGYNRGPGQEFYVQLRFKTNCGGSPWNGPGGSGGRKNFSVSRLTNSYTFNELVVQDTYYRGIVQMYQGQGPSQTYEPVLSAVPPSDFNLQPGSELVTAPGFCSYSAGNYQSQSNCVTYNNNVWVTYLLHVIPSTNGVANGTLELYKWQSGMTDYKKIFSRSNFAMFYDSDKPHGYNAFLAWIYETGRETFGGPANQKQWYDQIIISEQFIQRPMI